MPDVPLHSVGDVINGRYLIAELLGHGASGEVYVAKDPQRNGMDLAVKYLRWLPNKPSQLEQFKAEFAMLTHLSHPHIAKVYDFEQDDSNAQFFFTSELVRGKDFITATQGLSVDGIEELFVQALRALEYIHGNGIFHFDIKAANVLVADPAETIKEKVLRGSAYQAKLIDFGLATIRYQGKLAGTPSYMAPEMVRRENPDGRADLYSLGVLVHAALTGSNPFRTADMNQTMQNQLNLVPPPPSQVNPDVPPHLDAILMKLLEKRPTDRFQTAAQAIRDLNLRSPRKYAVETEETVGSYIPWESKFIGRVAEIARLTSLLRDRRSAVVIVQGASGSGKSRFLTEAKYQAQVAEWSTFFLTDPSRLEEWEKNVSSPSPLAGEGRGEGENRHKQPMFVAIDDYDILAKELWGGRIEEICKKLTRRIFAKQKDKQPVILMMACHSESELVEDEEFREPSISPPLARHYNVGGQEKGGRKAPLGPRPFTGPGGISPSPLGREGRGEGASLSLDPQSENLEIELSNFTLEDIRDYLATITGIPSPPQVLVEQVHTNTGGNPFIMTEVIKTLVGSGMLVDSQGRWKSTTFEDIKIDLAKMNVPTNIEDRLLRDMADVPDEARSIAQMMAVFGEPMGLPVVAELACLPVGMALPKVVAQGLSPANPSPPFEKGGRKAPLGPRPFTGPGGIFHEPSFTAVPTPVTRGTLMMLVRRGLVRINATDGTYYFSRPLLAKAIYSRMNGSDRMHWHDKIAFVISSPSPLVGEGRGEGANTKLLYHLSRGSDQTKARSALKELVEACTLAQRNHDAILHAQYYLEKWNEPEMRLNLARLYNRIGKYDLAIKTAEEMGSRSSPSPLGGEGRGEGDISPDDTIELSETTRRHEVTALEIIGTSYLLQKNFNAARQHFLGALQMVSEMSAPNVVAQDFSPANIAPPLEKGGRKAPLGPRPFTGPGGISSSPQRLRIENFLAEVAYFEGNVERAVEIYERTAKAQEALTLDEQLQIKNNNLGQAYFQKGEYKKAIDRLEKELAFNRSLGDSRLISRAQYMLAESYRLAREFERSRAQFDALVRHAKEADDPEHLFRAYNGLGNLCLDNGDTAEAAEFYERALDVSARAGVDDQSISCIVNLGVINANSGNIKKAGEYFTSALAFLEGARSSGGLMEHYHCRAHLELGEVHRLERQFEAAHRHLEEAVELAKSPACKELLFWVRLTQAKLAKDEGDVPAYHALLADLNDLATTPEKQSALKLTSSAGL